MTLAKQETEPRLSALNGAAANELPGRRILTGLAIAAVLLTVVTVAALNLDFGLGLHNRAAVLFYFGCIAAGSLVGGRYVAVPTVAAATVLADYYFTRPLYDFTPWQPETMIFMATGGGIAALAVIAARNLNHRPLPSALVQAIDRVFRTHVGAREWSAVYTVGDDDYAISAPGQDPEVTVRHHADAAHGLTCLGDCDFCRARAS